MQTGAIDIHHHYVPERVITEAKRHGKAFGIEVFEDNEQAIRFSFDGGPKYPLLVGLTDLERRLEMMEKGKISMAASIPARNSSAMILKGNRRRAGAASITTSASKSLSTSIKSKRWLCKKNGKAFDT